MARTEKPLRIRLRTDTNRYEIVGPHPYTGKAIREQTGCISKKDAQQYLERVKAGLMTNSFSSNRTSGTLADLLEIHYLASKDNLKYPKNRLGANKRLSHHLGMLMPWEINSTVIEEYAKKRRLDIFRIKGTHVTREGVKDSTILRELRELNKALTWAKRSNYELWFQGRNYEGFDRPKLDKPDFRDNWISKPHARLMVDNAPLHLAIYLELANRTGARNTAILELKWKYVDLENKLIDFGKAIGNKRRPKQLLSDELCRRLKEAKELSTTDYVVEFNGKPVKSVKSAFRNLCINLGFVKEGHEATLREYREWKRLPYKIRKKTKEPYVPTLYTPHSCKHTAITWMVQASVPYEKIELFTNTSVEIIKSNYGHHDPAIAAEIHAATDY